MNIMFSYLADLFSFLLIRNDIDFEAILCKEVIMGSLAVLRILDSFSIIKEPKCTNFMDVENEIRTGSASSSATASICASSNKPSIINLFFGTSSPNYRPGRSAQVNTQGAADSHKLNFRSFLFQQDRLYFRQSLNCYRTL